MAVKSCIYCCETVSVVSWNSGSCHEFQWGEVVPVDKVLNNTHKLLLLQHFPLHSTVHLYVQCVPNMQSLVKILYIFLNLFKF